MKRLTVQEHITRGPLSREGLRAGRAVEATETPPPRPTQERSRPSSAYSGGLRGPSSLAGISILHFRYARVADTPYAYVTG